MGNDDLHGWRAALDDLEKRREAARAMGGEAKLRRQRERGRLNARERVAALVDPGSFRELGALVGAVREAGEAAAPADALVAGMGRIERVRDLPNDERGRLLQRVAALGIDPDALLASERPSPGEARKLMLAEALARQVWALMLDEPTHHLDLPSLERLEEALSDYPGALLLVTHDDAFARRLARTRWSLEDCELRVSALP